MKAEIEASNLQQASQVRMWEPVGETQAEEVCAGPHHEHAKA